MPKNHNRELIDAGAGTTAWADALRQSVYDGISEADMKDVVAAIVKQAKAGDLKAAQFLFDYLLGGKPQVVDQRHLVMHAEAPLRHGPADRSEGPFRRRKLAALTARAQNGDELFEE